MDRNSYDVAVIGGGMAGLGAASTLARARRSVLVIDDRNPRNAPAAAVHTYPGAEGLPPSELLARARDDVARYGGRFATGTVVTTERSDNGFRLGLLDGSSVLADRLLVATGLVDQLPDLPGLAERWGTDVLHCPYCHGWEVADRPIAVLGTGPMAVHQALLWRQWSADVTLLRHDAPKPTAEERDELDTRGITVVDERVTGLRVESDRLSGVSLADGQIVPCQALVVLPRFAARAGFLAGLGLEPEPQERDGYLLGTALRVDEFGATDVPGVWAIGNVAVPFANVIASASAGVQTGALINMDLVRRDVRQAAA